MPESELDRLLLAATAIVSADGPILRPLGTAFRIAPQFAVTAAHVVQRDTRVRLVFGDGGECFATVAAVSPALPDGGPWPMDDCAVLRIERPEQLEGPCMLVTEPLLRAGESLTITALNALFRDSDLELYPGYSFRAPHPGWFTFGGGGRPVIRGMSGAPIWSAAHGGIVGFVKGTEGELGSQGGAGVLLLERLRGLCPAPLYEEIVVSHDRWHADSEQSTWADMVDGEMRSIRRLVTKIQGLVAQLPSELLRPVPNRLIDQLFEWGSPEPGRCVTVRDLVEVLATDRSDWRMALARFCALVPLPAIDPSLREKIRSFPDRHLFAADPARRRVFRQWADRNRLAETAGGRTVFGVILAAESLPGADALEPQYRFEVHERRGDVIEQLVVSDEIAGFALTKQRLKAGLDVHLQNMDVGSEPPPVIVVVLPDEHLLDDPLYDWRRADERRFSNFTMLLRRSSTWEKTGEQLRELERRWGRLQQGAAAGVLWLDCLDPRADSLPDLHELFTEAAACSYDGVAVTKSAPAPVLRASQVNSLPVTVWRAGSCREHNGMDCEGTEFRTRLLRELGDTLPLNWHAVIWQRQRAALSSDERNEFWRKIILLIDRPGESKRQLPMAGPGQARRPV